MGLMGFGWFRDDESITLEGILPSRTPAPLIAGFNTLTRIVTFVIFFGQGCRSSDLRLVVYLGIY